VRAFVIEDYVILGGGVAGLSAANQLVDAGKSPLIIDAGEYPCQRVCGEYFSHESLPILKRWKIELTGKIRKVRFVKENKKLEFQLPKQAGSCSRFEFDAGLFDRAMKNGAKALCKTTVQSLEISNRSTNAYMLKLSNGECIQAQRLLIGTGKLPEFAGIKAELPSIKYFGFKAHFEGIALEDAMEMHLFPGGYLGMADVGSGCTNVAVLISKDFARTFEQAEMMVQGLIVDGKKKFLKERMKNARMIFPQWLKGQVPEFKIRENQPLNNIFWIGDAAGGIPPVSGEGLAIGVTSGCMAADYAITSDSRQFRQDWLKRYRRRHFWAGVIHYGLMHPWISEIGFRALQVFPSLLVYLWTLTREQKSQVG
jgi:menaquinone-9 beta-reductase